MTLDDGVDLVHADPGGVAECIEPDDGGRHVTDAADVESGTCGGRGGHPAPPTDLLLGEGIAVQDDASCFVAGLPVQFCGKVGIDPAHAV
jgi:hypothetical protein